MCGGCVEIFLQVALKAKNYPGQFTCLSRCLWRMVAVYRCVQCRCVQCRCVQSRRKIPSRRGAMCCVVMVVSVWRCIGHPPSFGFFCREKCMPIASLPKGSSHPQKLHPGSPCRSSRARTQISSVACRWLTLARKPAHTHPRMLLSSTYLQALYLRGHGCWLVDV